MWKKLRIVTLVFLSSAFFYKACTKDESRLPPSPRVNPVISILHEGIWKISKFVFTHKDRTKEFKGDTFRFNRDGTITALSQGETDLGFWTLGANDDPNSFALEFSKDSKYEILTGEWKIMKYDQFEVLTQRNGIGRSVTGMLNFEQTKRIPGGRTE